MSKERYWEEFDCQLDFNYSSTNTYFGKPFAVCGLCGKSLSTTTTIKDSTGNILRDKKEIFSQSQGYFQDLLNSVRATPTDMCLMIEFGKEDVFTLTEVAAAIRGLKCRKAAGEDEIQSDMLRALNGKGVYWLTRVC